MGGEEAANASQIVECIEEAFPASIRDIEKSLRLLPDNKDFHFYSNFSQFRNPLSDLRTRAGKLLQELGAAEFRPEKTDWPNDTEEGYDWLVSVQDDLLEGVCLELDAAGMGAGKGPRDFELASKKGQRQNKMFKEVNDNSVKMASKRSDKSPIPFHVRSLPRPQDKFDYPVDNSNAPFRHLTRDSLLGSRAKQYSQDTATTIELHAKSLGLMQPKAVHPLEEDLKSVNLEDFPIDVEPQKYLSLTKTPFTYVELPSSLTNMAAKLRGVKEIAVDLEHNHYRSFQGIVCLMQISTRSEDFIIDTLILRDQIGPALRDVFANPSIRKVMHGADHDILWLQRDFGIYVCNLFDTSLASKVLMFERFSLAFLLQKYCEVNPDKRYQLADWRLRPLTAEMLKYAREDTHYLLYVYDMLRNALPQNSYAEVCKRSHDVCRQLYEKELLTPKSYLQMLRLLRKNFSPQQLAVLAALYAWRDNLAREEDESTGYIMPNPLLLKLAEECPEEPRKLHALMRGVGHAGPYAGNILKVIRDAKSQYVDDVDDELALAMQEAVAAAAAERIPNENDEEDGGNDDVEDVVDVKFEQVREEEDADADDVDDGGEHDAGDEHDDDGDDDDVDGGGERKEVVSCVVKTAASGGLGALLFAKEKAKEEKEKEKEEEADGDEANAKVTAERIRASLFLPFVSFCGGNSTPPSKELFEENENEEKNESEEKENEEKNEKKDEVKERNYLALDGDDEEKQTKKGDDVDNEGREGEGGVSVPPSLNQMYGKQVEKRKRKKMKKKKKNKMSDDVEENDDDDDDDDDGERKEKTKKKKKKNPNKESYKGVSFDYKAAALEEEMKSKKKKRERDHFDPSRRLRNDQFKADGLRPGKRRKVFPQSGNRTATFS